MQIHPVKLESYLLSEKQCWPAEGGFPKPIALCIPRLWEVQKLIDIFILFISFTY